MTETTTITVTIRARSKAPIEKLVELLNEIMHNEPSIHVEVTKVTEPE